MLAAVTFAAKNENAMNKAYCQVTDTETGSITGQLVYMGKKNWEETKCIVFFSELEANTDYAMRLHSEGTCADLNVLTPSEPFESFTTDFEGVATLAAREVDSVDFFIGKVITVTNVMEEGGIEACCVISTEKISDELDSDDEAAPEGDEIIVNP